MYFGVDKNYRQDWRLDIFLTEKGSLTLLLLNRTCPALANSVDPDQLASEEMNFYKKPGSSNLIAWKLEMSVAS